MHASRLYATPHVLLLCVRLQDILWCRASFDEPNGYYVCLKISISLQCAVANFIKVCFIQ